MNTIYPKANHSVDALYKKMRAHYGDKNPGANGYRLNSFFQREQHIVFSALLNTKYPILDLACGSGLMLQPLINQGHTVIGLDYNEDACRGAKANGTNILRGDAFNLPFSDNSIGQIVNCQFLNQQPKDETKRFIHETARVLKPGGRLILLWRNADSCLHIAAHATLTLCDRVLNRPVFPQYKHPMTEIKDFAQESSLSVIKSAVTLPISKWNTINDTSIVSKIIGASLFAILEKPETHK